MELTLSSSVQYAPRVGPRMAKLLEKLEIKSVKDLLCHIPFRYNDFSLVSPIANIQPGETVTITGTITKFHNAFTKTGKKIQEAKVADETDTIDVVWFNQAYLAKILPVGTLVTLSGKVDWFGNKIVINSPVWELAQSSLHTGRIVPVYPETEGVTSKWLRGRVAYLLENVVNQIEETLPQSTRNHYQLPDIRTALKTIHFPEALEQAEAARHRLAFEEVFFLHLTSYLRRRQWETGKKAHPMTISSRDIQALISSLPFDLTEDQKTAIAEIAQDLAKPVPMNRLFVGDVGSGKTVVAAIAIYITYKNGLQSALMAPTQILAEQHYSTIKEFLEPYGISVTLVTGDGIRNQESGIKIKKQNKFSSHDSKFMILDSDILVGTHALLFETVKFDNLGLVIIDEQHRFGVAQRSKLLGKADNGLTPHFLTMTATPIPRTMARTIFGNMDLSILEQIPLGRKKIKTWVVPTAKRDKAYLWIKQQLRQTSGLAFIICPLIEESETLTTVKSVKAEYARLKKIFSEFSVGLLHGRMKAAEKTSVLNRFRSGRDAILVSTPVVEVGIDVPNATIMMIEGSERFGLAQLHQLRGRVGRGTKESYCLLFTGQDDEIVIKRLKSMETVFSGPKLAEIDLTLRGPGQLFGREQHGFASLKIAQFSDIKLIEDTREAVDLLTKDDPELANFPLLRQRAEKGTIQSASAD